MTKICIFEPTNQIQFSESDTKKVKYLLSSKKYGTTGIRDDHLSFYLNNGVYHFINFDTDRFKIGAVTLLKKNNLVDNKEIIYATGGGAFKYSQLLIKEFNANVMKLDELTCLINGLNFLLTHIPDECYFLSKPNSLELSQKIPYYMNLNKHNIFPYILVNIGSGISILKVSDKHKFERVSGTHLGGSTYFGLLKLYLKTKYGHDNTKYINGIRYDETLNNLAKFGSSKNVDMLVKDIYGVNTNIYGLNGDLPASSMGKLINIKTKDDLNKFEDKDVARGLLDMISMNIAQIAYLVALHHKCDKILFAGNFLRYKTIYITNIY